MWTTWSAVAGSQSWIRRAGTQGLRLQGMAADLAVVDSTRSKPPRIWSEQTGPNKEDQARKIKSREETTMTKRNMWVAGLATPAMIVMLLLFAGLPGVT